MFRVRNVTNYLVAGYNLGGGYPFSLWKVIDNAWHLIAETDHPLPNGGPHRLEVVLQGPSISVWSDGVLKIQATELYNATESKHGMRWVSAYDQWSTFDNFTVRGTRRCGTLSASSVDIGAASRGYGVSLSAPGGCEWTAYSMSDWITLTSPTSGSGSATVTFTVGANMSTTPRTGSLSVGGRLYTVTQNYCVGGLSPGPSTFTAQGGEGSFGLVAFDECLWVVNTTEPGWLIPLDLNGIGHGSPRYRVLPNDTNMERTGRIGAGGDSFEVTQAAGPAAPSPEAPMAEFQAAVPNPTLSGSSLVWTCQGYAPARRLPHWQGEPIDMTIKISLDGVVKKSSTFMTDYKSPNSVGGSVTLVTSISTEERTIRCDISAHGRGVDCAGMSDACVPDWPWAQSYTIPAGGSRLALFLDVPDANGNYNFNPADPQDDLPTFLPGTCPDGLSCPAPSAVKAIQRVRVIAAYVDSSDTIVSPPPNARVHFSLVNTSSFAGIAMNAADPRGTGRLDFSLIPPTQPTIDPTSKIATVELDVWDYGGFTIVRALPASGGEPAEIRLPVDSEPNLVPDAGWRTLNGQVVTPASASEDMDQYPTAVGAPDIELGLKGDGLSAFEEFRGFMVRGTHLRTDPERKDLFIKALTGWEIGFATTLPTVTHILDASEFGPDRIINFNFSNGAGASIPHFAQRGLWLTDAGYLRSHFGWACHIDYSPCPAQSINDPIPPAASPNESGEILIFVATHYTELADNITYQHAPFPYDPAQIANEVRRTIGHEIGHGVHICHHGQCQPLNDSGVGISVMSGGFYSGPPVEDPKSVRTGYIGNTVDRIHG